MITGNGRLRVVRQCSSEECRFGILGLNPRAPRELAVEAIATPNPDLPHRSGSAHDELGAEGVARYYDEFAAAHTVGAVAVSDTLSKIMPELNRLPVELGMIEGPLVSAPTPVVG